MDGITVGSLIYFHDGGINQLYYLLRDMLLFLKKGMVFTIMQSELEN